MTQNPTLRTSATVPGDSADIVDLLVRQHERILSLLRGVPAAHQGDKRRIFAELARLLHAHESAEHIVVHPVLRDQVVGGVPVALARMAEESEIASVTGELVDLGVDHPRFDVRFETLRSAVIDHIAREEREEFPRLRQFVPAQRLHSMANQVRNIETMS
jgi:Hemerythrin HHE cation binding domain